MVEMEEKPVLRHKYSMDATLERSIPVVEAEKEVSADNISYTTNFDHAD